MDVMRNNGESAGLHEPAEALRPLSAGAHARPEPWIVPIEPPPVRQTVRLWSWPARQSGFSPVDRVAEAPDEAAPDLEVQAMAARGAGLQLIEQFVELSRAGDVPMDLA